MAYRSQRGGFNHQSRRNQGNISAHGRRPQSRPAKKGTPTFNPEQLCQQQQTLPTTEQSQPQEVIQHQFADFKLAPGIDYNLRKHQYTQPTPIQDQVIPSIMAGRDVIGLANTGTGKTAAFLLPLIHKVVTDPTQKVLIISPTRELAFQIRNEFERFAEDLALRSVLVIGGVNINHQIKQLSRPAAFVIGTPGRIMDLSRHHKLSLATFQNIVLDEVDQMLDMGFIHDIKQIIAQLASDRQSLFFSATMNPAAQGIAQQFLQQPVTVNVRREETAANVEQKVIKMAGRSKNEVLNEVLEAEKCQKTLIFARTKHGADKVVRNLSAKGYQVGAIHGNKTQNYRLKVLDLFKKDRLQILVATDVASRGLDINQITHVINYDLPATKEDYIHRIGRTGRADARGVAISLVE